MDELLHYSNDSEESSIDLLDFAPQSPEAWYQHNRGCVAKTEEDWMKNKEKYSKCLCDCEF